MAQFERSRGPMVADVWVIVLSGLVCHRLLFGAGYGLGHDMVFTPRQPLTPEALGVGSSAPRAVPVDGLLALATSVVDGTWVGRFAVFGVLVLAGSGMHRAVREWRLPARLAVAGLAVWNPFVIERLSIGQWSLLAAYAAFPWLLIAVARCARHPSGWCGIAPVVGWLGLSSITPTGGIIAALTVVVLGAGRGRTPLLIGAAVLTQLPWLLPALVTTAGASSDPAGVAAFATRTERPGGPVVSLLGLGGIWDAGSTPDSRSGVLGYVTSAVVVAALVLGRATLRRAFGALAPRLAALAGAGFALALVSAVPGGAAVMRWAVQTLPGAGLLRDSQKWLLPFAVLAVLAVGAVVQRVVVAARRIEFVALAAVVAAAAPVLLLPDAVASADRALTPVRYPSDFKTIARIVDGHGALATLPFEAYRRFAWGQATSVADPASRWFDTTVETSDELVVGTTRLHGEDPRAAHIATALRLGRPTGAVLAAAGVRWALVYLDAPGSSQVSRTGLQAVFLGAHLALYRVPGPVSAQGGRPGQFAASAVELVDGLVLAVVLAALGVSVMPGRGRRTADTIGLDQREGRSA